MRDFCGAHVSQIDEYGVSVDVDEVRASISAYGSFRVIYVDGIDRVCVSVADSLSSGGVSMCLTLRQAQVLRELLDAGIADAVRDASSQVGELPSGASEVAE